MTPALEAHQPRELLDVLRANLLANKPGAFDLYWAEVDRLIKARAAIALAQ